MYNQASKGRIISASILFLFCASLPITQVAADEKKSEQPLAKEASESDGRRLALHYTSEAEIMKLSLPERVPAMCRFLVAKLKDLESGAKACVKKAKQWPGIFHIETYNDVVVVQYDLKVMPGNTVDGKTPQRVHIMLEGYPM